MKRRAYLVTAAAATLGGCSALSNSETSDEPNDDDDDDDDSSDSQDPIDESAGSFDQFDDLSMWTVMEGSLELDNERAFVGEQSGRMEATESERRVMIKRRFDQPRDLSDEFPAMAFATEQDVNPIVQLTDTDGNRLLLQCDVPPGLSFAQHDLGIIRTDGDPDLSSIAHIKISAWAGDRSVTVWCDDLHFVSRPDTGKVLLQFDAGDESTATRARSALSDYDFPATAFVPTDYVGGSGYVSRGQLETLQSEGWTIASGSTASGGLAGRSESAQRDRIQGAIEWLESNGFEDGASYFGYPLNRYDETTMALVEEHHDIGFVGGYGGHADLLNPAIAPRAVGSSADEAKQLLDQTAKFRTITTLNYVDLSGESGAALEETLSYLSDLESAGDLEVVGPDDIASNHVYDG
ncbi:polysaccharide deacetylase family protein [Natrinema zhouii]|uniref:Polysaccharide deacetylase family protein n=1 Tax=Natrinema zhouii TaxID=1710539 RepID=A0A7D6GY57_9EURY|nr:polysaccharide deacetylase family protein [Natrinema zhouii]QLK24705.1 polysaccharide deacetylase family protein [Natrinema zhouii]